jgi:lysozyme
MVAPLHPADVSPALKAHIKQSERLMLKAYFDPAGVPTIGWGHIKTVDANDVRRGHTITEAVALALFEADLDEAERAVRRYTKVRLNQNQFDALVDFVFNLGAGAFQRSTLLKKLNAGDYAAVPAQLLRWNKAKNPKTGLLRVLPGLTIRRQWEADLWSRTISKPAPVNYPENIADQPTVIPEVTGDNTTLWGLILNLARAVIAAFTQPKPKGAPE